MTPISITSKFITPRFFIGLLACGAALCTAGTAQAQPGGRNQQGGQGGFGGPGGGFGGPGMQQGMNQRADFRNFTMEQRQQMNEQVRNYTRELSLRMMLENAGFPDKAVQDAVIAFANAQEKASQTLRDKNRDLMQALYGNNNVISNAQLMALQNAYSVAAEDETDRRTKALTALDAKINYTKQPRLAAVLTILGLNGDAMALVESNNTNMGGQGGFGGPGGGFGGQGGGFGGQGGGFGGPGGGGPGGFGGGQGGPGGGFGGPGGGPGGGFGGGPGGGFGGGPGGGNQPRGFQP